MKKLSGADYEMLWGDGGPYSEAKIVINTRILDAQVSRVMLEIECNINPTTFRLVKKNKEKFADFPIIVHLLESAEYLGKEFGYRASFGAEEYIDEKSWQIAKTQLEYVREAIIIMHEFVMEYYNLQSEEVINHGIVKH